MDTNPKAMYNLQKYNGISSRYTCPHCGRKRCFTLYVDEAGDPLHESVGRCDHESSCGYHYTPKQYFTDYPDLKPGKDWRDGHPIFVTKPKPKPLCFIPDHVVNRSVRFNHDSDPITFLKTILDPMVVEGLIEQYHIGVTRGRDTIFFQIDKLGRCRTGKVMKYDPDTGHRIKDENTPGRITWVHSLMKQSGQLPRDWELTQCLFGEHLLLENPGMPVALVESEKTAVICAGLMPRYLWLATGGKSQLSRNRLSVLAGRKVIAFPDIDAFADWSRKLAALAEPDPSCPARPGISITVSPILQQNATAEDLENHIDIADWLIRYRHSRPDRESPRHCVDFLKAARYISPEYHDELEALIQDLDLEFWGVERAEPSSGKAPESP